MRLADYEPILRSGDQMFVQGTAFVSKAIRWATRSYGEPPTLASHTGRIVSGGTIFDAMVVEALFAGVRLRSIGSGYLNSGVRVAVVRPLNLSDEEIERVCASARSYIGKRYGYGKIFLQAGDALLGRVIRRDPYCFRRMGREKLGPICSWITSSDMASIGKDYGLKKRKASPDDQWDFAVRNPDKYQVIRPFAEVIQ